MVELADLTTHFTTHWVIVNIELPTMKDKNLGYSTLYPHFLFFDIISNAEMKVKDVSGGLDERITYFFIHGVYDSKANANLALIEIKTLLHSKTIAGGDWHVFGDVKFLESATGKRIVVVVPCRERILLLNANW